MRVMVLASRDGLGEAAADVVVRSLRDSRHTDGRPPVLGVATGSSPLPLYESLARRVSLGLDLSECTAFALDEYIGLPPGDPRSYRTVVRDEVTVPCRLDPDRVHVPDGDCADPGAAATAYEQALAAAGGVDLQVLGIGTNGHLAFNEPGSPLDSLTRVVELSPRTRTDNARFFDGDVTKVPTHALTQGLGTVRRASRLLLIASGGEKAQAVARALTGPVTDAVPASLVQQHPDVTVLLDDAAAAALPTALGGPRS